MTLMLMTHMAINDHTNLTRNDSSDMTMSHMAFNDHINLTHNDTHAHDTHGHKWSHQPDT